MASLFKRRGSAKPKISLSSQDLDYLTQNTELKDREVLQTQFDEFIKNHPKGYMKQKDFEVFVKQLYPTKNVKKIQKRLFNMLDKDRDGHITFREFMMVMCIMANGTPDQNLRQIFKIFDDNNDGTIDMKEMKKFAKDINILLDAGDNEAMKDKEQVKDTFNVWDQNSDGKITEDEFVQAVMNHDKIATMLTLKIIDILSHDSEEDK